MMVLMLLFLNLFLVIESFGSNNEESVKYYVNLITNEHARVSTSQLPNNSYAYRPLNDEDVEYGTFDHIVVGAGAAGAIVASRLSEDQSKSVLLIEAGDEETNFTDIPSMSRYSFYFGYGWNYYTIPQNESCLAMENRQCTYRMGKGLGGSTIINDLFYARGNARDYNNWHSQGNRGWAFHEVLPFFKKTENSKTNGDFGYHGFCGNLNVEYEIPDSMSLDVFLEANRELRRHIGDYNGRNPLTVGKAQLNTIGGRRGSTSRAFLRPFRNRVNLKILTKSYATKILIDNKKAHGIRFAKDQEFLVAKSRKDIIISASAIGTPQLLMLSGIGPKLHLQELDIPVEQDLSVGNYLKNHFSVTLNFTTNYTEPEKDLEDLVRDYLQSKGPLTNANRILAVAFVQTNVTKLRGHPDIELLLRRHGTNPTRAFSIQVIILHPKSHGYIRLKSKDPFDYPRINPSIYSDAQEEDVETMYQGIQLALELLNTNAFRRFAISLEYLHLPACENYTYLSKEFWYCQIKQLTVSMHHSLGTCKMGPDPAKGAVVDHKLKVYGIENLRVADASVMPDLNSGHTSAPAMMIGEKAAHMIKFG